MKKLFILIAIFLLSVTGYGQGKGVLKQVLVVPNDTCIFNTAVPKYGIVLDYSTGIFYKVDSTAKSTSTISSMSLPSIGGDSAWTKVADTISGSGTLRFTGETYLTGNVSVNGLFEIDTIMYLKGNQVLWQDYGLKNIMLGAGAGFSMIYDTTSPAKNTVIGINALNANIGGQENTSVGYNSGLINKGDGNIFLGAYSGRYDSISNNLVVINSIDRSTLESDSTKSIIWGVQNADSSQQVLKLNANVRVLSLKIEYSDSSNQVEGRIIYDTTINRMKYWDGTSWRKM